MSSDKQNSEVASDTTCPSEPHLDARGSESDFLVRQCDEAKFAISATLRDLANRLKDLSDVKEWTKEYPLAAVSAAGLVGFLVAKSIVSADPASAVPTPLSSVGGAAGVSKGRSADAEQGAAEGPGSSPLRTTLVMGLEMAMTAALGAIQTALAHAESKADIESTHPGEAATV